MPKIKLTDRGRRNASLIALLLFALLVAGILSFVPEEPRPTTRLVHIPNVTASAVDEDGRTHPINAVIAVDIEQDSQLNALQAKVILTQTLGKLDYIKMRAPGNIVYLQTEFEKAIRESFPDTKLAAVYISEFQAGDTQFIADTKNDSNSRQSNTLRGMFRNLK
ncbi:hypothetical protein AGMMS49975_13260 [Clostridia bacterium]|nr:hypothetical protein AGMMS49975_13260 [Clostridia bacterium]GHU74296.1 hypothetical protein FACS1894188_02090 [Clostridia bacterium]